MFKLRPYLGLLFAALFVLIIGGLLSAYFFIEDAYRTESRRAVFCAVATGILTFFLILAAFSRYGFKHLRHHRPGYKRG